MRKLLALVVLAGCGSAAPHIAVRPAAVEVSPVMAARAARAVMDVKYGVDPHRGDDHTIFGRTEWLDDAAFLVAKWERGKTVVPMSTATFFRAIAIVESPTPGQVAVRIVGETSTNGERFDGLEGPIQSGDPLMPQWAEERVAHLQLAINQVLRQYAVHPQTN